MPIPASLARLSPRAFALASLLAGCGAAPAPNVELPTAPGPVPSAPASAPASAASTRVDVPRLEFTYTPESLTAACVQAETDCDARLAAVVKAPVAELTFAASFGALEDAVTDYNEAVSRVRFMKNVHGDPKVRDAAAACDERSGKYVVGLAARKDLFDAMRGYQAHRGTTEALDASQKRLAEITMRDFRRNGLDLPDAEREALVELRKRISELESRFHRNLGEDKTTLVAALTELDGVPPDFVSRHEKTPDGKGIVLTVKYPDFFPVMQNAKSEALRRRMLKAFDNRGGEENLKLLDEATRLRAQAAHKLGFATHVDYVAQPNMARDAKTIDAFLTRMRTGLKPGFAVLVGKMEALKRAEMGAAKGAKGAKGANATKAAKKAKVVINAWDYRYYMNEIHKRDYALDNEAMRAYFPAPKVMEGLFGLYSQLFGVRLVEVPGVPVWAEGVKLYEIRDAATDALTARFYVDLYPREGKYGHAAEFNMAAGHQVPGGYRIPLSVLVANFAPPSGGKVAQLSVDEVETLFHEFGHVMHESLTTAKYASLAGTNVARDFVEVPSQMLENWLYEPEVLALVSQDPADPSKPMPREMMDRIVRARDYDAGVFYTRQVYFGLFDQTIHTQEASDANATAKRLWAEAIGFPEDPDAHFAAGFGHVMGGYDGQYYGYLWSQVYCADMFMRFKADGIFSTATGKAFRDTVLAPGRTEDADVLLRRFLGREPSEAAFLKQLGIQ